MPGLIDLIGTALSDTKVSVNADTLTRNIVYTPIDSTKPSKVEALVQLNQLVFKMENPRPIFAYGNKKDGTKYITDITDGTITIVGSNRMIESLKGQDFAGYNSLKQLFEF
jgi:hypothetical protein